MIVEQTELDTYYLEGKDGELIPFFNIPYDEFEEIFKVFKGIKRRESPPPSHGIQEMDVSGRVIEDSALLEFRFEIKSNANGWIRVPLRLSRSVLRSAPTCDQDVPFFVTFEKQQGGYICWIKSETDQSYDVHLSTAQTINRFGENSSIELSLPKTTFSKIQLDVPVDDASVQVNKDETLLETEVMADGHTRIRGLWVTGEIKLDWRPKNMASTGAAIIEVQSTILAFIESRTTVRLQAELTIQSLNTPVDHIFVRLPKTAELLPVEQPGSKLYVADLLEREQMGLAGTEQIVRVDFEYASTSPSSVLLSALIKLPLDDSNPFKEIGGFQVEGAIRQSGTLDLVPNDDWHIDWRLGPNMTRVPINPAANGGDNPATAAPKSLARFEFYQQPFSVQVRVRPERRRIETTPEYIVFLDRKKVTLQATLQYRVAGVRNEDLKIDLQGWTLDGLSSKTLEDAPDVTGNESEISIPLAKFAQSFQEDIVLVFDAHFDVPEGADEFSLPFPQPIATAFEPGLIVMVPENNIELTSDILQLTGTPVFVVPDYISPFSSERRPIAYRCVNSLPEKIEVQLRTLRQTVDAHLSATLEFFDDRGTVENQIDLSVQNEPLTNVWLNVPTIALESNEFKLLVEGQIAQWEDVSSAFVPPAEEDRSIIVVQLLQPLLGDHEMTVTYPLEFDSAEETYAPSYEYSVPLAYPVLMHGEQFLVNPFFPLLTPSLIDTPSSSTVLPVEFSDLEISHPLSIHITPQAGDWSQIQEVTAQRWSTVYTSPGSVNPQQIPLSVSHVKSQSYRGTTLEKLWLQTRFAKTIQYDRAAILLSSNQSQIRIGLPEGIQLDRLAVNGVVREYKESDIFGSILVVDLGEDASRAEQLIELWYHSPRKQNELRNPTVELPSVEGARWIRACFVQVAFPPDEYAIQASQGFMPELSWIWSSFYWARRSKLSQPQLEQWIGVAPQASFIDGSNHYLYSCFSSDQDLSLVVASRLEILLGASLGFFALGVFMMYVPAGRHPLVLLVIASILIAVAIWFQDLALQATQFALVASIFIACAFALKRVFLRRPRMLAPLPSAPSVVGSTATHAQYEGPSSNILSTTDTIRPIASQTGSKA